MFLHEFWEEYKKNKKPGKVEFEDETPYIKLRTKSFKRNKSKANSPTKLSKRRNGILIPDNTPS